LFEGLWLPIGFVLREINGSKGENLSEKIKKNQKTNHESTKGRKHETNSKVPNQWVFCFPFWHLEI